MKLIVTVCGRQDSATDRVHVVELDSPISLKQLRQGLRGTGMRKHRFGVAVKDPESGIVQWIVLNKANFNEKYVESNSLAELDPSTASWHMSVAAWPKQEKQTSNKGNSESEPLTNPVPSQALVVANQTQTEILSDQSGGKEVLISRARVDEGPSEFVADKDQLRGNEKFSEEGVETASALDASEHQYPQARPLGFGRFGTPFESFGAPVGNSTQQGWRGHQHRHGHGHGHGPHHKRHGHGPHSDHGPRHWNAGPHSSSSLKVNELKPSGALRKIHAMARFTEHVSLPDDTIISCGEKCVKVWRVRNDGLMAWPEKCQLIQVGGPSLLPSGVSAVPVPGGLKPGEVQDLKLEIMAPEKRGLYHSFFRLRALDPETGKGAFRFGQRLWIKVLVMPGNEMDDNGTLLADGNYSLSSSSSTSDSSSSSDSDSDNERKNESKEQKKVRKRKQRQLKKDNKRIRKIRKLERDCKKLRAKLHKKSCKLEKLKSKDPISGVAKTVAAVDLSK